MLQRHPFTLVSTQPASFVIQAQNGFTKALHMAARRDPGGKYRAAIEGPYCVVPDTRGFDKVVLIAGGTGATFTVAMALEWARRHRMSKQRSTLHFIWIVRNKTAFGWLDSELAELKARMGVSIDLYVSGPTLITDSKAIIPNVVSSSTDKHTTAASSIIEEKTDSCSNDELSRKSAHSMSSLQLSTSVSLNGDHEKTVQSATISDSVEQEYRSGRPDLASLVKLAVSGLELDDRVLVTGEVLFCSCLYEKLRADRLVLCRMWLEWSATPCSSGCR